LYDESYKPTLSYCYIPRNKPGKSSFNVSSDIALHFIALSQRCKSNEAASKCRVNLKDSDNIIMIATIDIISIVRGS